MQYDLFGIRQAVPNKESLNAGSTKMILDEIKQVVKTRYSKFAETGGNKESC